MGRRFWIGLGFTLVFCLLVYGIPFLILGWELTGFSVVSFFAIVFIYFAFSQYSIRKRENDAIDALWAALEYDYPGTPIDLSRLPMGGGIFGSSDLDDFSVAISAATDDGLSLCRPRKDSSLANWVRIPWEQISAVELIEPDQDVSDSIKAKCRDNAVALTQSAKVKLIRNLKEMTLVVPWNDAYGRFTGATVAKKTNL